MESLFFSSATFLGCLIALIMLAIIALLLAYLLCELWELIWCDPLLAIKIPSWLKKPKRPIVAGDVVKLKSGGPRMVVDAQHYTGSLYCRWFDGNKTMDAAFPKEALEMT